MDIFGVIRGVIEVVESSEYDPEEAAALERAIRLSLTPPQRPSFRPLYERPSSPARPPPPHDAETPAACSAGVATETDVFKSSHFSFPRRVRSDS